MDSSPVLIAGGGIAGLAAALGLSRIGLPARLFERQAAFSEVGAGLQMSPNGVRALRWLGAWEAVERNCFAPSEILVRDGATGGVLQRVRLGGEFERKFGAPYRVVHRGDLLGGLLEACRQRPDIDLLTGRSAVAAEGNALEFSDESVVRGRMVVGCDGIHSPLRRKLSPDAAPRYRGHALYRALIPIGEVPASVQALCVTIWLHPKGHVVHYPVKSGRYFNIVAAIDSAWHSDAWNEPGALTDLMAVFGSGHRDLTDLLAVPPSWLRWAGADLPGFGAYAGPRLVLMGDAAHATLPYLAQGAMMALEDACVLARTLATGAPLTAFDRERRPRCARIQAQSRRQGRIYHAGGVMAAARNAALRLMPPESFINRNAWIYRWAPPE